MSTYKNLETYCLPQPIGPVSGSPFTSVTTTPTDVTLTGSGALLLQADSTLPNIHVRFTPAGESLGSPSVGTGDVVITSGGQRVFAINAGDRISMRSVSATATVTMSYCRES